MPSVVPDGANEVAQRLPPSEWAIVPTRFPPLRPPATRIAHLDATAPSVADCTLALRLGATGLEARAALTSDGACILSSSGGAGRRLRRGPAGRTRESLGASVTTLDELYNACGVDFELLLDVADEETAAAAIAVAVSHGVVRRLWICHPDLATLSGWRGLAAEVRLVDDTRLGSMRAGVERRAAQLREAGIDAVRLPAPDWTAGLTALFHRFERLALAHGAHHERAARDVLDVGVDGVSGSHVDRIVDAALALGA